MQIDINDVKDTNETEDKLNLNNIQNDTYETN